MKIYLVSQLNKCLPLMFESCLSAPLREESSCSTARRHNAWHAAMISSRTEASLPRHTQTVPGKNASHSICQCCSGWVVVKRKFPTVISDHVIMSDLYIAEFGRFLYHFWFQWDTVCCCSSTPTAVLLPFRSIRNHFNSQYCFHNNIIFVISKLI